jgi:disulfide bond formation protein DsbB
MTAITSTADLQSRFAPWVERALRRWPLVAGLSAAAMLASAHAFERFAGMAPCLLCYRQREVYWAVLAIVAATAWLWWRKPEGPWTRGVEVVLGAAFLTGAVVAGYHAGVEWGLWQGPQACSGSGLTAGSMSAEDFIASLEGAGAIVRCDAPPFVFPFEGFGLSMAGWNAVMSLVLAAVSLLAAARGNLSRLES